jgi:tRNA modification GTPase
LSRADLVICVLDGSEKLKKEDREILDKVKNRSAIVVINKCDLRPKMRAEEVRKIIKNKDILKVSCIDKIGVDKLEERIYNGVWSGKVHSSNEVMVNNIRHKSAIGSAVEALSKAEEGITHNISPEFVASDIRRCADSLGEITGETYTEDILNVIFSRFCIGK